MVFINAKTKLDFDFNTELVKKVINYNIEEFSLTVKLNNPVF